MSSRRRTEIVIETHEVLILRRAGGGLRLCGRCAEAAPMVTPREAAARRDVSQLTIYRWVDGGRTHFQETADGGLFVCLASLPAQDDANGSRPGETSAAAG